MLAKKTISPKFQIRLKTIFQTPRKVHQNQRYQSISAPLSRPPVTLSKYPKKAANEVTDKKLITQDPLRIPVSAISGRGEKPWQPGGHKMGLGKIKRNGSCKSWQRSSRVRIRKSWSMKARSASNFGIVDDDCREPHNFRSRLLMIPRERVADGPLTNSIALDRVYMVSCVNGDEDGLPNRKCSANFAFARFGSSFWLCGHRVVASHWFISLDLGRSFLVTMLTK